jgi:hypothetical protein
MNKLIRDGYVAVLISGDYGAGWSTWNRGHPDMLFDPDIAQMILDEKSDDEIAAAAEAKWPDVYIGGLDGLAVQWIPVGTEFTVDEYDGFETISYKDQVHWIVA